jgi:hypothetical protein
MNSPALVDDRTHAVVPLQAHRHRARRRLSARGQRLTPLVRGNPLTQSEVYDPAADTWTLTGSMASEVRFNHSVIFLPDGRVLVAGGKFAGVETAGVLDTAQLFDPVTNQWHATAPMHHAPVYHASVCFPMGGSSSLDAKTPVATR